MTVMKKIFYLMSICALAFISCQKEELADNTSGKYTYTFTAAHVLDTKAAVGDKNDNKWPVLWEKGDQLGVYLSDGTFVGVANLTDESAGKNSGTFTISTETQIADGTSLKFSYPYVENAASGTGVVAAEQTLASAASAGVGANAVAFAEAVYTKGQTNVALNHVNAYLKFDIASAEGAFAGYNLDGITLWADDAVVSGTVNGDNYSNTGDYVKVSLSTPVTVGTQAQPLWLTSLPADLSECQKVYAIVHMSKGIETVTLPVRLNGAGNLPAGSVTEITLPSLTKSLAPAWYEPVETRYIAAYGEGWSYGPENTVLFTTTSNQEKTVELKARGNFMKVKEPKYVQLQYACNRHKDNYIAVDGKNGYENSAFTQFEIGADYSVKVNPRKKPNDYGFWGAMLVKDADQNVIWGINLWASYSVFEPIQYANGNVLPFNIGAGPVENTSTDTWYMNGAYFQWGRPFAMSWSNSDGQFTLQQIETVKPDLEMSASNPYTMFSYKDSKYNDWYYEKNLADLWGNPSKTGSGVKSIYDPCPKGYRVISPAIVNEIRNNITVSESNVPTIAEGMTYKNTGTVYNFNYKGVERPFAGGHFNNNATTVSRASDDKTNLAGYWTNGVSGTNGYLFFYQNKTGGTVTYKDNAGKAQAYPVRCMVDTENR